MSDRPLARAGACRRSQPWMRALASSRPVGTVGADEPGTGVDLALLRARPRRDRAARRRRAGTRPRACARRTPRGCRSRRRGSPTPRLTRSRSPGVPATISSVASCPVRPWRASRRWVPISQRRRWGVRSRHQRPVRSSSSVARGADGKRAAHGGRGRGTSGPRLVTWRPRAHQALDGSARPRRRTPQPASVSSAVSVSLASSPVVVEARSDQSRSRGAQAVAAAPGRKPSSPGRPVKPETFSAHHTPQPSARRAPSGERRVPGSAPRSTGRRRRARSPSRGRRARRPRRARARCSRLHGSGARVRWSPQPFVEPRVRPATNCFWSTKNTISTGSATSTEPAESRL